MSIRDLVLAGGWVYTIVDIGEVTLIPSWISRFVKYVLCVKSNKFQGYHEKGTTSASQ